STLLQPPARVLGRDDGHYVGRVLGVAQHVDDVVAGVDDVLQRLGFGWRHELSRVISREGTPMLPTRSRRGVLLTPPPIDYCDSRKVERETTISSRPVGGAMAFQGSARGATFPRLALAIASVILSVPLAAQWVGYPTAGAPRKADGSVNMTAPAPRLATGQPDFSGIWISDRTEPGKETISDVSTLPSGWQMQNLGANMEGGLPYQPWQLPIVK